MYTKNESQNRITLGKKHNSATIVVAVIAFLAVYTSGSSYLLISTYQRQLVIVHQTRQIEFQMPSTNTVNVPQ